MPVFFTTLTAVTVYAQQARVLRQGNLMVTSGRHDLLITGLPSKLLPDSVRVSGYGTGVTILDVDLQLMTVDELDHEQTHLQQQIADLRQRIAMLDDEQHPLKARLKLLRDARDEFANQIAKMIAYRRATVEDYATFARFASEEQHTLLTHLREIREQRAQFEREIAQLEAQLLPSDSLYTPLERRYQLQVRIEAIEATSVQLDILYMVNEAAWTPLYDVRLQQDQVELQYLARVTQHTGEDWRNAELSLSTARIAVNATLPELTPQYIAPTSNGPVERQVRREFSTTMDIREGDPSPRLAKVMPSPVALQTATLAQVGVAMTFRIPIPVTIQNDGAGHTVMILTTPLKAYLDYLTVPKLAQEAYLRATIVNTSDYTLLPGTASIFHQNEFVGKTHLRLIAPGEQFEAYLGMDARVKVKRELLRRDIGKRLIGMIRQTDVAYQITVQNLTEHLIQITVKDQIPLSQNEFVRIKLTETAPSVTEQTALNLLTWEVSIPPDEEIAINFAFNIEQPRDLTLSGLE
ncbi:MAG: mucoidy inhibitor MuiA family protein [Anaerolineae bacterium]|jgi:uncharacterized protein (TIGR02231 family)|nr:mucoidy inhibitor MuiA family protein [Anaerolineae bacterium]